MKDPLLIIHTLLDKGRFDVFCKRFRGLDIDIVYEMVSISDTIVIYSFCKEEEVKYALEGHGKIADYFISTGMENKLLLRGATSVGDFQIEKNVFVGKAIDEAASWYEKCDWMGVIMTPSADFTYRQQTQPLSNIWVKFKPFYKNIRPRRTFCVNWTLDNRYTKESLMRYFNQFRPITTDIASKFDNTIFFFEKMN